MNVKVEMVRDVVSRKRFEDFLQFFTCNNNTINCEDKINELRPSINAINNRLPEQNKIMLIK